MSKPGAKDAASSAVDPALQARGEAVYVGMVLFINLMFGLVAYGTTLDPGSGISAATNYALWACIIIPIDIYLMVYFFKLRRRTREGKLTVGSVEYPYILGNTLTWYTDQSAMPDMVNVHDQSDMNKVASRFRGLKVTLPVQLPHVYFDNKRDWGIMTPYLVDPAQKINLEGDFPNEYQAYVPKGGVVEALSVFQPDVLQAILRNAHGYDIEFYGNELRIISRRSISGSSRRRQQIIDVAISIIEELENRFGIWSRHGFQSQPLIIYRLRGVMIGRVYLSFAHVTAVVFLALPGFILAVAALDVIFEITGSVSPEEKSSLLLATMLISALFFVTYWIVTANIKHKESAIRSMWGRRVGRTGIAAARRERIEGDRSERGSVKTLAADKNDITGA